MSSFKEIANFGTNSNLIKAKSALDSAGIKYIVHNEINFSLTPINSNEINDRVPVLIHSDNFEFVIDLFVEFGLKNNLTI